MTLYIKIRKTAKILEIDLATVPGIPAEQIAQGFAEQYHAIVEWGFSKKNMTELNIFA